MWKQYKNSNYEVATIGLVRNIHTKKILAEAFNHKGYVVLTMYLNGKKMNKKLHRVVAETYKRKKKKEYNVVNHINCIKVDCYRGNLDWTDVSGNTKHACNMGLIDMARVRSFKQLKTA